MFASLSSRIAALGTIVVLSILALAGLLIDGSHRTRESFRWVTHSAQVIETTVDALAALREAESGQRGFVLTRDPSFAQSADASMNGARQAIAQVVFLTRDNPLQNGRAHAIRGLMARRIAILRNPLELARHGRFDEARHMIGGGHGRDLMTALTARAQGLLDEEHVLQTARIEAASRRLAWVRHLALIGGSAIAGIVVMMSLLIVRGIRQPLGVMRTAMTALGRGDREVRITSAMGSREFTQLAAGYNAMADRLETAVAEAHGSEERLQDANEELRHNGDMLRERSQVMELLGGMAHRMQAARTDEELAQVIRLFVPRVMTGIPGALFVHNNSRNLLVPIAEWGGLSAGRDGFAPGECWALRRGQSHVVAAPGSDIICGHVADARAVYHCEPLLAGGEVIGVLHLHGLLEPEHRFRLTLMAENIASALVNHRLQRNLREQTIRDPLTGLFNRRYMEETLTIEIARAARSGAPLSLVMCDVDHFKRFNDEFGHDAGDAVLKAVAAEMRGRFRDGDVVCRFGGEEFTIIAPGTTAQALASRVELVRQAIADLTLRQAGRTLGATSMSFGIATLDKSMNRDGSALVKAADAALYRAKREGRNRAVVELREAA